MDKIFVKMHFSSLKLQCALALMIFYCINERCLAQNISPIWQYDYVYGGSPIGGVIDSNDVYHLLILDIFDAPFTQLLSLDTSGNVVSIDSLAGEGYNPIYLDGQLNSYFIKENFPFYDVYSFNSSGIERWHVSTLYNFDPTGTLVSQSGDVYLTTTYQAGDGFHWHIAVSKIDSSGNLLWTIYPNPDSLSREDFNDIALNEQGDFFITGDIQHDGNSINFYTAKIKSNGSVAWTLENGYDNDLSVATGIAVDDTDNVYIAGYSYGPMDEDVIINKIDSSGSLIWTETISSGFMDVADIALDSINNVLVYGEQTDVLQSSIFVAKYDNSGIQLWTTYFIELPTYNTNPGKMALDHKDDIILLASATAASSYWENYNYTTIKYSSAGVLQWYSMFDNTVSQYSQDKLKLVSFDSQNNVIVAGNSYNDDGVDLKYLNIFKFDGSISTNIEQQIHIFSEFVTLEVFPNPATETVTIKSKEKIYGEADWLVYDLFGREVFRMKTQNESQIIVPVSELAANIYFVEVNYNGQKAMEKFIKE